MKSELLQSAVIEIDDDLIEGADVKKSNMKIKSITKRTWLAAACVALSVVTAIGVILVKNAAKPDTNQGKVIIDKHFPSSDSNFEICTEPTLDWEEMTDTQRFPSLKFGSTEYCANFATVSAENEGEFLGTAIMTGEYIKDGFSTGELRTAEVRVYSIRGIDKEVALAIRFGDDDRSYAYTDLWYSPSTLGEFIEQLNLREYMKTALCYYYGEEYYGKGQSLNDMIVYEDVPTSDVWAMLLDDMTPVNEPDSLEKVGRKVMGISVNLDVLGNHNKTITITDDGYLWTNLLETEKCFFIGTDKVEAFIKAVTENHQGYHYIYDVTEDKNEPENESFDGDTEIVEVATTEMR